MSEPTLISLLWSLVKSNHKEATLLTLSTYLIFLLGIVLYVPCHSATLSGQILPWITYQYIFGEYSSYCQIDIPRVALETVGLTALLGIALVVLKLTEAKN